MAWLPFLRPSHRPRFRDVVLPVALAALWAPLAAAPVSSPISPGPRRITAEEESLKGRTSDGSQQGIILSEESERDDRSGRKSLLLYRVRAKVFSNEGRDLGDVEIPYSEGTILRRWWGWTLLSDGKVLELPREDLHEQVLVSSGGEEARVLKAALPGVVPGCVVEYGYQLEEEGPFWRLRVELQGPRPIREFRYHWLPFGGRVASARISRAEGLSVNLNNDSRSVLVTGRDLPSVVEEPYMPPLPEVRAAALLYYRPASADPKTFWTHVAKKLERQAGTFAPARLLKSTLAGMNLPSGDLESRLRAVFGWLATHIEIQGMRSAEAAEAASDEEKAKFFASDVLESGRAASWQMDDLFLGFARVLGAEAHLVLATDRTDKFFDPSLLSTSQFDWAVVALRQPGDPTDQFTFVDPVIGLPYGEIPWWIAGAKGYLADPKGGKTVLLQPAGPIKSLSESQASISPSPEEGTAVVRWSRSDTGQAGLRDRLALRTLGPEKRRKRLERMCGSSSSFEVTRAESPGLQDLTGGLKLECEGTLTGDLPAGDLDSFSLRFHGPWEESVPELTAAGRVHPVVFPFLRIDRNVIDVDSPPGYAPAPPVAMGPIESPYGQYALFISATPHGYHLERVFSLTALEVPPSEYGTLRAFLAKVRQADQSAVLFRKVK